ncbi:MAG: GNAT family N-acetyltransferase [Chloroflexota bacterium]
MTLCSPYTIRPLAAEELAGALLEQALSTFAGALGYRPGDSRVAALGGAICRHALLGGFRAFGALSDRDRLVGFSYGYTSQPGLWWREQISKPLSAAQREYWLTDAFELAELHVHPSVQGQRCGSRLHDKLIHEVRNRTALLSVMHRSERARQLYMRRGWQTLVQDLRFSTEPRTPFSVLGLTLYEAS